MCNLIGFARGSELTWHGSGEPSLQFIDVYSEKSFSKQLVCSENALGSSPAHEVPHTSVWLGLTHHSTT